MTIESQLLEELLLIMARLRDPKSGCPWDLAQTFESIVPHTLEEAYEVAYAIEKGDYRELQGELGDVLLQILFYCQIAQEQEKFNMHAVMVGLKEKLISRHPHLFGQVVVKDAAEQHQLWQSIKANERKEKLQENNRVLADIPLNLPGLSRAQKLQQRAAEVGFDWPNLEPVLHKLREEVAELEESCRENETEAIKEELGDILFVCANIARHMNTDAEAVMRKANAKFEKRFNFIEDAVQKSGKAWDEFTLEDLEVWWQAAKRVTK